MFIVKVAVFISFIASGFFTSMIFYMHKKLSNVRADEFNHEIYIVEVDLLKNAILFAFISYLLFFLSIYLYFNFK